MRIPGIRLLLLSLAADAAIGQIALPLVAAPAAPAAVAEEANPAPGARGSSSATIALESRLIQARAQLAALEQVGLTNGPAGVPPQDLSTQRLGLRRLVRLYELQISNAASLGEARASTAEIAREAQAWERFEQLPPYSILLLDRLQEEAQIERQKLTGAEAATPMLDRLKEENQDALRQAERKIRQLNEQLESADDPAARARLAWQRDLDRLGNQVAAATIAVLDSERLLGEEGLAQSRIRLGLLQRQIALANAAAQFTQADLDQVVGRIEQRREQLERELAEVQPRQLAARRALADAREANPFSPPFADGNSAASRDQELLSVRGAELDAADTAAYVLRLMLEGVNIERTMWELRFAAYDSRSVWTLRESGRRLGAFMRRLNLWLDYARQKLDGASSQLSAQEVRLNSLRPESSLLPMAGERLNALRQRDQMLLRLVREVERVERLSQRWAQGLRADEAKLPLSGRLLDLFSDARSFLGRLWSFEIFAVEDSITVDGQKIVGRRSVTVSKVAMAIVILVVGYWITGLITRFCESAVVKRLKIEPNQANLIRRWLRAFLVMCLLLFSLVSVKIPLTVFAFCGGALAIGLGFGTQTLLKNFVSGLILLFERPFRVGDVLDVSGQKGTVTGIGLRASVLQLWDGTETLIPNSTLLESNVTNWTYSNRKVRFMVSVGVAYGSDPRQVIQLLGEVAERHGAVESEPNPQVLFTEFGENALNFELRFWVDVSKANAPQVSSDLRRMIASSFAEKGIGIAFPQRDLHLHSARPLKVQVVQAANLSGPINIHAAETTESRTT